MGGIVYTGIKDLFPYVNSPHVTTLTLNKFAFDEEHIRDNRHRGEIRG